VPQIGPEADALVARPVLLPSPDDEEVERLLRTVALRVVRLLRKLDNLTCDGVIDALRAQATRRRLPLDQEEPSPPKRRCAFLEGFSLHANTRVHENDRDNLRCLCSYGARGPLSLERLSRLPDGRLAYRMKRPAPPAIRSSSSSPSNSSVASPARPLPRAPARGLPSTSCSPEHLPPTCLTPRLRRESSRLPNAPFSGRQPPTSPTLCRPYSACYPRQLRDVGSKRASICP
jgi:hypothetical protein